MRLMSKPLHELTIAEASTHFRTRSLSPVEFVQALIDRANELEPQINVFITRTSELALVQARQAELEIFHGRWRGPLHGVPFALKDIYDTAGILTTGNSRGGMDRVPQQDAAAVKKLYGAGAVLLGKLATHELAHGGPSFDLPWPPARNPWDTACFTGGSSSGSAAAVAADLTPAALGSDTGGSIRGPASFCGISGMMPTYGLVSRSGVIPNSFSFDRCGPMAHTMEDCAILLQSIAGYDPADGGSIACSIPDYRAVLSRDLKGLRVGVLRHYWEEEQLADQEVVAAIEQALSVLRDLGATVEDTRVQPLKELFGIKTVIAESEIFAVHLQALQQNLGGFGLDFLQRVLPACLFSANDYCCATREHRRIIVQMTEVFERYDVLVTTGQGAAPRLDAHDPLNFWTKPNPFLPSNLTGGPAASVCNGFSSLGMPFGMQVIGRPFDDATVLRVGYAFQQATDWHDRRPRLISNAPRAELKPATTPADEFDVAPDVRVVCNMMAKRAGLNLNEQQRVLLYRAAPYAIEMSRLLRSDHAYSDMPANIFQHPHLIRKI